MVAWMAGRCDGDHYGEILVYEFPKDRLIYGPMQIEIRMNQDDIISKDFTLWNQQGSQVVAANQLVVPLSDFHLLYVKPIYLQATVGKMPELKRVLVASCDKMAYATSFQKALEKLISESGDYSLSETESFPQASGDFIKLARQYFDNYQKLVGQGKMREAGGEFEKLGKILGLSPLEKEVGN
jgi:uncharacterized membrane protein (UPF0182 family)